MTLVEWDKITETPGMRPGAPRRAVAGEHMSVARVTTSSTAIFDGSMHRHRHEQVLVMLGGELRLSVDGRALTVKAGDLVFFPSGSLHGATGVGPEGATYYEIFSPPRYDQLPGYIAPSPLEFT